MQDPVYKLLLHFMFQERKRPSFLATLLKSMLLLAIKLKLVILCKCLPEELVYVLG